MYKKYLPTNKYSIKKDFKILIRLLKKLWSLKLVKALLVLLIFILIIPFVAFYIYRPIVHPDINYGITFSDKYAEEIGLDWQDTYIKIMDDLGADHLRLIAYWDDIEAERDVYDYSNIKWQLDEAEKRDVKVILTMGRKVPRWPECFEPTWWHEIESENIKDLELLEFVKTTTEELKGFESIYMWQVENEPFFEFGVCNEIKGETVDKEVEVVRSIDDRPILIQDSGEGGYWYPTYQKGDYLAISMYRKIWYDFWGLLFKRFVYFQYPLPHWSYKIKADVLHIPTEKIIVTELQAEPWGPRINSELTTEEKDKTMSRNDFLSTLSYAQKSGFQNLYLWGAEWWLWEKEVNNNPFYWDTAKALFN